MPIYAFRCTACDHAFDRLQKLSDPDPDACPSCGAAAVTRQVTAPSFRLAGGGWYETDFKKDGDRKRNLVDDGKAKESKPADTKSDAPAAAKPAAEAKPAAKPDTAAKPAKPAS